MEHYTEIRKPQQKANIYKGHAKALDELATEELNSLKMKLAQQWQLQKEQARTATSYLHYATSRLNYC